MEIADAERRTGRIFDIQYFSVHDGPGIRTTVFFQGCPLRCRWCHNPEGFFLRPLLRYQPEHCIFCGRCRDLCPKDCHSFPERGHQVSFSSCTSCGICAANCPSQALSLVGRTVTAEEILQHVLRDRPFYGEEGGLTCSGGECMTQSAFLTGLLRAAKEQGISTAVDTSGMAPWKNFEQVAPYVDWYLYDIKAFSEELHRWGTGVSNRSILENYRKLAARGSRIWVRIPLIPGFNATLEEMDRIAEFLSEAGGAQQIRLIPYHTFGKSKYLQLGMTVEGEFHPPEKEEQRRLEEPFRMRGLPLVI